MSTWIAWPPDTMEGKFPQKYFQGDPLNEFQEGFEEEKCISCGFSVKFISNFHQYNDCNKSTNELILDILKNQKRIGECRLCVSFSVKSSTGPLRF